MRRSKYLFKDSHWGKMFMADKNKLKADIVIIGGGGAGRACQPH